MQSKSVKIIWIIVQDLHKSLYCIGWTGFVAYCYPLHQQINFGLLVFSLVGFLLPGYLFYHRRHLTKQKKVRDQAAAGQSAVALNHSANGPGKLHADESDTNEA